ncbi:MAG: hypothetical protein HC841_08500 [Verrucomicrobiae bacterium]|nr:hypothetical protein [Verrucomicrobiae bacterium]
MPVAVMKTKSEVALTEQFQTALPSLPGGPEVASHRRAAIARSLSLVCPIVGSRSGNTPTSELR